LIDIAKAIQPLKHLREFPLGQFVKGTVTKQFFLEALGIILKKIGLEVLL